MLSLSRIILEATQYGLTPRKIKERCTRSKRCPKILANSLPKAGTNLLLRALYLTPGLYRKFQKTLTSSDFSLIQSSFSQISDGQFCAAHLKYSQEAYDILASAKIKHLLMLRDPRDVAVSNFIYITYKDPNHRLHHHFRNVLKSDDERLAAAISGVPACNLPDGIESRGLVGHYVDYLGWLNSANGVHVVKFENLIGEIGGGSRRLQLQELEKIGQYLEMNLSQSELEGIASGLFSSASRTFNRGVIGGGKRYFKDIHYELLNRDLERFGVDLGYDL